MSRCRAVMRSSSIRFAATGVGTAPDLWSGGLERAAPRLRLPNAATLTHVLRATGGYGIGVYTPVCSVVSPGTVPRPASSGVVYPATGLNDTV